MLDTYHFKLLLSNFPSLLQILQYSLSPSFPADYNKVYIYIKTVFALAVMENAVGVSKFGKNPMTLLVHQY